MYSVDNGQNFQEDSEFYNLAVGNYNVVVQDASGVCEYEVNVPVEVEGGTGITENSILENEWDELALKRHWVKNEFDL